MGKLGPLQNRICQFQQCFTVYDSTSIAKTVFNESPLACQKLSRLCSQCLYCRLTKKFTNYFFKVLTALSLFQIVNFP
jgi:hypothetical protein